MNVLQKIILRAKPDIIINKNIFQEIDLEILEYAIKCGLDISKFDKEIIQEILKERKNYFFNSKVIREEILKLSDEVFLQLITDNSFDLDFLSEEIKKDIFDRVEKAEFSKVNDNLLKEVLKKHGRFIAKTIIEKPDFIKKLDKKNFKIELEIEDIKKITNTIKRPETNISIADLPYSILERPGVVQALCEKNVKDVQEYLKQEKEEIKGSISLLKKSNIPVVTIANEVKKYILSNPKKNIEFFEDFYKIILHGSMQLIIKAKEKEELINAVIENDNVIINDEYPYFLQNAKTVAHSILNAKDQTQINNLKRSMKEFPRFVEIIGEENLVSKLKEIGYMYNNRDITPDVFCSNPKIMLTLIENNPYTIEDLDEEVLSWIKYRYCNRYKNIHEHIIEILEKNDYMFSSKTPSFLLEAENVSSELVLDAFELDYDNFRTIPKPPPALNDEDAVKFLKREYEIIKEHDPNLELLNLKRFLAEDGWSTESKAFLLNPFVFKEALTRGLIPNNWNRIWRQVLEIPHMEQIAPFIKKYIEENNVTVGSLFNMYFSRYNEYFSDDEQNNIDEADATVPVDYDVFMNDVLKNFENIDNYKFNGIALNDKFILEISNKLLESNYKITEKTPKFLLLNNNFLIRYINNKSSIENIPKKYVIRLFTSENLEKYPECISILQFAENIKTPVSKYLKFWGKTSFTELINEYGYLIKYLDITTIYSKDEAKEYLKDYLNRNSDDMLEDELYFFFKNLKVEIKNDDFKKITKLSSSDKLIKYAMEQNPKFIEHYNGKNEDIIILAKDILEDDSYLKNKNFASSTRLISALIKEKSAEYIKYYIGQDYSLVDQALEMGIFYNKDEAYIKEILQKSEILKKSDNSIKYLIENYDSSYIEQYKGSSEDVFNLAVEKGYVPTFEKLINNFYLSKSEELVKRAIKDDVYCNGFIYSKYSDSEKLEVVKQILGQEIYEKIFFNKKSKQELEFTKQETEFLNLTSIINQKDSYTGIKFLKLVNKDFINEIGFDEWKKIVKYSFNNIKSEDLYDILNNSETTKLFLNFVKNVSPLIKDDQALGVNKFLTIAKFYNKNPEFCQELIKRFEEHKELSEIEKVNLQTLMYRKENNLEINDNSLKNLISIEQQNLINGSLNSENFSAINRNDIFVFLFNMTEDDICDFLKSNLNSKTIAQIVNRAKEDNNKKLLNEANYMGIIIDIIENIVYNYSYEALNKLRVSLATAPQEKILQIRKTFGNITEMTRQFYEIEAQEELIDINKLKQDAKICKEYNGIKVIDLSKIRHTFYAHVFSGEDFNSFFNTDKGKVTICVSPETDKHEEYYDGKDISDSIRMFFSEIPKGSFIGSSPKNMGSNSEIDANNYEVRNTSNLYNQKSIRESYSEHGHAETLLYREGLVPQGLRISELPPSDFQIQCLQELQKEVRKIEGHEDDELVFITTQGTRNRTINYAANYSEKVGNEELEKLEDRIKKLRKSFFNIFEMDSYDTTFLRIDANKKKYYTLEDSNIYTEEYASEEERNIFKLAVKLEQIVHKNEPEAIMEYKEYKDKYQDLFLLKELTDSRNLWHLTKENGAFSKKTTEILLKEFIVDHLMCNYSVGNEDFALNSKNVIKPVNKKGAFKEIDDFISTDGALHTEMSYYYYVRDSISTTNGNNNVYRKVFESYINSPGEDNVIDENMFNEMLKTAEVISKIPTEKYMQMFSQVLENIKELDIREKTEKLIKARKENIVNDTEEFIERIKNERKINKNIEEIESTNTIALINDIHGNAAALEELLKKCQEDGKKDIFVLGDMIGFGAESNRCINLLREYSKSLNIRCILGNHELYCLMGNESFKRLGNTELELTTKIRKEMSIENRKFLESLPIVRKIQIDGKIIEFTHFPIKENYENDFEMYEGHGFDPQDSSGKREADYVIYGHEHRTENTFGDDVGDIDVSELEGTEYINLPSSGCVHGKNTTYSVIDIKDGKLNVEVKKIPYDKEKNDKAIKESKNPYSRFFGAYER